MVTLLQMVGASFVLVQLLMIVLWLIYYQKGNAGIADIGWCGGFLLTMIAYFFLGYGSFIKTFLLLLMVVVWSGRLGIHIFRRYMNTEEDARYQELKKRWGEPYCDYKFLVLFVFQGVLVTLLSLPFLLVSCCPNPEWSGWEILGISLWILGVAGEYFADEQLYQSKQSGTQSIWNKGLWRYTRHPNYFFEWVVWLGFFFYGLSSTAGIMGIISPIIMYCLLRYVSGVPLTEAHLIRTKGEEYRRYQASTSEFFPWFPSKDKAF